MICFSSLRRHYSFLKFILHIIESARKAYNPPPEGTVIGQLYPLADRHGVHFDHIPFGSNSQTRRSKLQFMSRQVLDVIVNNLANRLSGRRFLLFHGCSHAAAKSIFPTGLEILTVINMR